jgi:hypothetical protein
MTNTRIPQSSRTLTKSARLQLLREVLEAAMWELRAIRECKWEDLPILSAKKQQLLTRMSEFDWTPLPEDRDNPELMITKAQIVDLEFQIKKQLEQHLSILKLQLSDLKRRQGFWKRALMPYRESSEIL